MKLIEERRLVTARQAWAALIIAFCAGGVCVPLLFVAGLFVGARFG